MQWSRRTVRQSWRNLLVLTTLLATTLYPGPSPGLGGAVRGGPGTSFGASLEAAAQTAASSGAPAKTHPCQVNDWDLDVEACYPNKHGAGAKIIACLDDVNNGVYPVGTVCDARGIIKEGAMLFGDAPIEIGARVHEELLLPNIGNGLLQTAAQFLPTPEPPRVAAVEGKAYLAGTYFFRVNFRTGDAVSASSSEVSAVATASAGRFSVALPKCPAFATSVDITASPKAGGETLQGNGMCGSTITLASPGYMYSGTGAPTKATTLPGIILHNETKSALYSEHGAQGGFFIEPESSTFAGSNLLAVTGNGYSMIKNLGFYNNVGARSIIANVYDVGCYASCVRDHLFVSAGDDSVGYKLLGQYNDVKLLDPNFVCAGKKNARPLEILATPGNAGWAGMDTESIHSINIIGGLIGCVGPGNTSAAVVIRGRSSEGLPAGTALPTGLSAIHFWGTTFELGNQQIGVEISDTQNIDFDAIFSTDNPRTAGARFLQLDSSGTYAAGFATTSQVHISKGSSISWPTIVVNNINGTTVPGNVTNGFSKSYDYGGGDDIHASFSNTIQSEGETRDTASPISTQSFVAEVPAAKASIRSAATFTGDLTAGSKVISHVSPVPSNVSPESGIAASQAGALAIGATITAVQGDTVILSKPALKSGTGLGFVSFAAANFGSQAYFTVQASTVAAHQNNAPKIVTTGWRIGVEANSASLPDPGTTLTLAPYNDSQSSSGADAGPHNWQIRGLNETSTGALFAGEGIGIYPLARAKAVTAAVPGPPLTFYSSVSKTDFLAGCALTPAISHDAHDVQTLAIGGEHCSAVDFTSPVVVKEVASGSPDNSDINGQLTLRGGSATYTFQGHHASSPICTASDTSAVAAVRVQTTRTTLVISGTNSDVINYICVARD